MHRGSEEEADAELSDGFAGALGRDVELYAEGFEDVGGAAAGAEGAIPVLGDARTRTGGDEGGGGGDVERAGLRDLSVAAGTAGVDQRGMIIRRDEVGVRRHDREGVTAHGAGEADQFVDSFALIAEGDEQSDDVGVVQAAPEQLLHERFGFRGGEVAAGLDFV